MDSKWSWVVCGSTFVSNMLTVGFSLSVGVYYVEFLHVFGADKGTTALISSLNYGTMCFAGPVASFLIHRWGHRVSMFCGGLVSALGLLFSSFATNIYMVVVSFGFITGLGFGLAFTASVVVISVYFRRLRPLAYGLSLAGAGTGNVCFPWVTSVLIKTCGWRGALMITSGLLLHICVGAMLIMKSHQEKNTTNTPENSNKENVTKNNDANKDDVHDNNNHSNSAKTMTLNLISNVLFILLLISSTIFLFGQSVVFTHIIAFAESLNLSQSVGSAMVSAIGVSALIGRVVLSMLSQLPWVDSTVLYIAAVTVCGVSTILLAVWHSAVGMLVCSCVFGFCSASFGPTLAEVLCHATGTKLFNFAYGYLIFINGVGWLLGPPVAGLLYEKTQHYPNSFYLGGVVTVFGALVMIPVKLKCLRTGSKQPTNVTIAT